MTLSVGQVSTGNAQVKYLAQEIVRIWERLGKPVEPTGLNLAAVAGAVGEYLDANRIRGVKSLMEGKEIASQLLSINESPDKYALWAAKPSISGNTLPAVRVDMDDDAVEGLRVAQAGEGYAVYLDGLRGAYPILYLKKNGGAADYILTDNGAHLTNAGAWTDACTYRRKRYVGALKPAQAVKRIRKLRIPTWTPRRGKGTERHMSPSAEQFHRLFKVGSAKGIAAIDLASAGLLGVQWCVERIEALEAEVRRLKRGSHG